MKQGMNNQKNNNNRDEPDSDSVDQWFKAIAEGDVKTVKAMLNDGFPVNFQVRGSTAVTDTIDAHDKPMKMKLLRILLDAGADTRGAIHQEIAVDGNHDVLKLLLDYDADINEPYVYASRAIRTPLQYAMMLFDEASDDEVQSMYNLVLFLLDKGADPNIYQEYTDPPITQWFIKSPSALLHTKKDEYAVKIVKKMVSKGANVNTRGNGGRTPLVTALIYNLPLTVQALLREGADPNIGAKEETTPLRIAILQLDPDMVKTLLLRGADPNKQTEDGSTPLMVASIPPNIHIMEHLLKGGADPNTQTKKGTTSLSLVANEGSANAVRLLMKHGAKITPDVAKRYRDNQYTYDVMKALGEHRIVIGNNQSPPNIQRNGPPPRRAYAGFGHGITNVQLNPHYRDPAVYGPAEKRGAWERRPSISKYIEGTFVVPENCVVVLKGSPDALVNIKEVDRIIQNLSTLDAATLENPQTHLSTIVKKIGPVSVYGPGDTCPNVMYYFYPEFQLMLLELQDTIARYRIKHSSRLSAEEKETALKQVPKPGLFHLVKGLIPLPFDLSDIDEKAASLEYTGSVYEVKSRILIRDIVEYLYKDSVIPLTRMVHAVLGNIVGTKRYNSMTLDDVTKFDMDRISHIPPLVYSQEILCKSRPGVYYYTVCRQYQIPKEELASGWAYWQYTPNIQKSVNPRIQNVKSLPPHIQRIVKSLIGEAETKRKHTVKKMYNNRQAEAQAKAKANQEEKKNNQTNGGTRKTHKKQKTRRL